MAQMIRPRPRILHLFSDWKWTGPAEPIVNLCRSLRRHGHVVDLACARPPGNYPESLEQHARERLVEPILDFSLKRGGDLFVNFRDIRLLAEFIDQGEIEIIHCHTRHDHYIGSRAARRTNNQPFIVRTSHYGAPHPASWPNRWLICGHTDGWVALTSSARDKDVRNFRLNPAHAIAVDGAVDLERFNATSRHADVRPELGLSRDHVVAGIVARVQRHRRFDVLLPALARAMKEEPSLRAVIIGRGTQIDSLARRPARALGIVDKVVFAGYRSADYADYLACLDFKVFLVPGSDGSCRAAREAMAMGKPIIAARRGLLPDLVEDGRCGLVIDDTPENLAEAILKLARDRELRTRLGRNAAEKAWEKFDIARQVEAIAELYMRLAEGR